MQKKINQIVLFFCLLLVSNASFGQNNTSSPFSIFGIGDLMNNGYGRSASMGGVSTPLFTMHSLNPSNPASYASIAPYTFIFEVGLSGNWYTFKNQSKSFKKFDGNITSLAIGFPVNKWWKAGFGITPISNVGYNIVQTGKIDKDTTYSIQEYQGQGGINSFYFDNSFDILKSFSIGAKVSYLFGSLDRIRAISSQNAFSTTYFHESDRSVVSSFAYMLGAHFHKEINKNFYLNIGAKYGFNSDLSAEKELNSYLQVSKFGTTFTNHIIDTTYKTSEIPLPSSFSIGTSAILYQKLELGFDYQVDNWSKSSFGEQIFADNQRYSFGLEFVPDFGSSVYWKLVRYRAGFNYTKSYIMYNNSQLKQLTGSFGMGFPLRSGALINIGLLYSHREIPNTDFFTEDYLQLNLNFSFKANWFVKKHFY